MGGHELDGKRSAVEPAPPTYEVLRGLIDELVDRPALRRALNG